MLIRKNRPGVGLFLYSMLTFRFLKYTIIRNLVGSKNWNVRNARPGFHIGIAGKVGIPLR
jgi:hypothetical protein